MKIVHIANFSESKNGAVYYAIDRKLTNGLIRNGHFVYDFSYREISKALTFFKSKKPGAKKMNKALLKCIDNIKPELILLGHSELVYDETLSTIKKRYPDIKIAMWWVDPFDNISHICSRIPLLDAFFATTDPEYYHTLFTEKTKFFYLPNVCDDSIEQNRSYENIEHQYDLIFIGRDDKKRKDFIDKLNNLENINFKQFGHTKNDLILGNDYMDLLYNSKMAINYSRYNDISLYSSDRIVQLTAQGVLTFTPRIPNMEKLFSEEEVVYFEDFEDLRHKLKYYNTHDTERIKIAKAGYKRAHKEYNSTLVTKQMLNEIFKDQND